MDELLVDVLAIIASLRQNNFERVLPLFIILTTQKMTFCIKDLTKFAVIVGLVTSTEEILNRKLRFLCSVCSIITSS